jgi:hypothetical protein
LHINLIMSHKKKAHKLFLAIKKEFFTIAIKILALVVITHQIHKFLWKKMELLCKLSINLAFLKVREIEKIILKRQALDHMIANLYINQKHARFQIDIKFWVKIKFLALKTIVLSLIKHNLSQDSLCKTIFINRFGS